MPLACLAKFTQHSRPALYFRPATLFASLAAVVPARTEYGKYVKVGKWQALYKLKALVELARRLAREAHNQIRPNRGVGHLLKMRSTRCR